LSITDGIIRRPEKSKDGRKSIYQEEAGGGIE
jgi:hypothetical protein